MEKFEDRKLRREVDKLEIAKVRYGIKKVRLKLENKLEFIKERDLNVR